MGTNCAQTLDDAGRGWTVRECDNRFLSGRQESRWVEDRAALTQRVERSAPRRSKERRRCRRMLVGGPPRPRFHTQVIDLGRCRRCGGLSGAPGTCARTRGSLKWLGSSSELIKEGLDQRRQLTSIRPRTDLVVAAGPGKARRAHALEHQEHECPGPDLRQPLEVS